MRIRVPETDYMKRNWKRRNEMEHTIEIPADAKTVTLELKKRDTFTLRSLLPRIKA